MKKFKKLFFILIPVCVLLCALIMIGKNIKLSSIIALDNIETIRVEVVLTGGKQQTYTLSDEEMNTLKKWISAQVVRSVKFPENQSPGDFNGGRFWLLYLNEDDFYVLIVEDGRNLYVRCENQWYVVQ